MGLENNTDNAHELNGIPIIEAPEVKAKPKIVKIVRKKPSPKSTSVKRRVQTKKVQEPKVKKERLMDKEIDLKINPRGIARGFVLIILLFAIFMAGRWSVDSPQVDITGLAVFADDVKETVSEKMDKSDEEVVEESVEEVVEDATDESEAEEVVEVEEEAVVEEVPEDIITTYNNVEFEVTAVNVDWKGTWGKVSQLTYTIINNEEGTIEPDHLVMMILPAYEDIEKEIMLPLSAKSIKAGQKYSHTINIPSGFAYNEITVGSLTSVPITVLLEDASDKRLDGHTSGFNLVG